MIAGYDIGDTVICDRCGQDWTGRPESGGLIYRHRAYCPDCEAGLLKSLVGEAGEYQLVTFCPAEQSFWNFVVAGRGGDNTIRIYGGAS